ncbi:MADS box transcription factor [Handroanthus impetiginosus]|uniref:MADS box transcription factor n=1 Tax=Handroanthus impetiginosus TaxID=429701 RepID=A0A2G9I1J2_9LAMI|nr:MADS box transcription factor [Handroanthus impetiginosus]
MVRRRIEIELIEDKPKRHTTFTKRRKGLEKKTRVFCNKFDVEAAILTVSEAGNAFGYGHPSVDMVLDRYLDRAPEENNGVEERLDGEVEDEVEEAAAPLTEVEKRIVDGIENGKWEVAIGDLGLEELGELEAEMRKIKSNVVARAREIAASEKNVSDGGSSAGNSSSGSFRS